MPALTIRRVQNKSRQLVRKGIRRTAPARAALGSGLRRTPLPTPVRVAASKVLLRRPWSSTVPVEKLLLGPQNARDFTAAQFAGEIGDLMWPSTPVADGPHVALLRLADKLGDDLTDAEILDSPYGSMAAHCIRTQGRYFGATDPAGVLAVARSFIDRYRGGPGSAGSGHSRAGDPILVAPIKGSDHYQVLDGHHRVALAIARGARTVRVTAKWMPVTTPLQDLLTRMSWLDGDRRLYQPLPGPELRLSWPTVRRCTDRLEKMTAFLDDRKLLPPATSSYLDVASCYGWFVKEMSRLGYEANGMERDPLAPPLGRAAYGLEEGVVQIGDCVELLRSVGRTWDVVSCFSLLHHFALGRGAVSEKELIRLLDAATGAVLFFDTGQDHEQWFAESLRGWDTARVAAFLREHTTFDEIIDLGPDADAVPPHERNYGRHLFACVRTPKN
jgi:hypothetical protein